MPTENLQKHIDRYRCECYTANASKDINMKGGGVVRDYAADAKVFKALCDENRLRILEILRGGESVPASCYRIFRSASPPCPTI